MGSVDELCVAIEDVGNDAVEVVRRCLLFCRERAAAFERGLNTDDITALGSTVLASVVQTLRTSPLMLDIVPRCRTTIVVEIRAALAVIVSEHHDEIASVVVHRVALGLEQVLGTRFLPHLSASGPRILTPDDLVPFASPFNDREKEDPFLKKYGRKAAPAPKNLGATGPDQLLSRARLVPPLPHGARLRWHPNWSSLDELDPDALVAGIIPSVHTDLVDPPTTIRGTDTFFIGVAPRDAAQVAATALRLVQDADRLGAKVVVLPEVCLTREGAEGVAAWIEAQSTNIAIAVCGSFHDVEARRNLAFVVTRRARPDYARVVQAKIVPFVLRTGGQDAIEDIRHADCEVTLLTGRKWALLTQICIDFVDDHLSRLARDLRATLVLVPACTKKTGPFHTTAADIAMRAQAHVVVVNQALPEENEEGQKVVIAATAIIARPWQRNEDVISKKQYDSSSLPGMVHTRLAVGPWEPSV